MSNPTHRRKGAGRGSVFEMMRSKTALASVALVVVLGFIGALIAFSRPDVEQDEDPAPIPSVLPSDVRESLEGKSTCVDPRGGQMLVSLDDASDVVVVSGEPAVEPFRRTDDETGIQLVNGQSTTEGVVEASFDRRVDVTGGRIGLWIRHSGGIISPPLAWKIRLITDEEGAVFERYFTSRTVREAAATWCFDMTRVEDWTAIGGADATRVTGIQLTVPDYLGAGAGSTVAFDDPVLVAD